MKKKIEIPSNKSFGIVFFVVFLAIGLYPLLDQNQIKIWSILISLMFLFFGLLNSKLLSPFNRIWTKFGFLLGNLISPIIMGMIFFIVVTPIGIIMKILKKDLINLKKKDVNSYWVKKKKYNNSMKDQF